jgi:hypothetical protein
MIISSQIFQAHLECSTKCWLRSRAESITGNAYAEWARAENEAYYEGGLKRLFAGLPESDRAMGPPISKNFRDVPWRIAADLRLRTNNLETLLQAVEKMPSEGRGRTVNFVPYRFEFANKITKSHKLSLAFDARCCLREQAFRSVHLASDDEWVQNGCGKNLSACLRPHFEETLQGPFAAC